jgi:hypothetical protein
MTAIDCENMQLPHEERTHRCGGGRGVFMETREANQQGGAQASSHLWLGCLTFAWDDGLAAWRGSLTTARAFRLELRPRE